MNYWTVWGLIILTIICIVLFIRIILKITTNKSGMPWSGPHHSAYEMSNGHMYYLYPVDNENLYILDGNTNEGRYFSAYSGNDGPFIHSTPDGFRWVLQWHGDTISIERVPNNVGLQPDYYLIGNKIPNDYKTRSYNGNYVLTDRNMGGGPTVEGHIPTGFIGYVTIQSTGIDLWVSYARKPHNLQTSPTLYKKELDNGYNARTYSAVLPDGQISKIIFYDSVNFQMLNSTPQGNVRPINGTRM